MLAAIGEIGRNLVAAEVPCAAHREMRSFALAPVVGRIGLPRILVDLRFRERAGQPLALLIDREPRIRAPVAKVGVEASRDIALSVAAVAPVALRVFV